MRWNLATEFVGACLHVMVNANAHPTIYLENQNERQSVREERGAEQRRVNRKVTLGCALVKYETIDALIAEVASLERRDHFTHRARRSHSAESDVGTKVLNVPRCRFRQRKFVREFFFDRRLSVEKFLRAREPGPDHSSVPFIGKSSKPDEAGVERRGASGGGLESLFESRQSVSVDGIAEKKQGHMPVAGGRPLDIHLMFVGMNAQFAGRRDERGESFGIDSEGDEKSFVRHSKSSLRDFLSDAIYFVRQ